MTPLYGHATLSNLVMNYLTVLYSNARVRLLSVAAPEELRIANAELVLLHTRLLYERQKRELHAERNRRILSKIAQAEKIKEHNKTLVIVALSVLRSLA